MNMQDKALQRISKHNLEKMTWTKIVLSVGNISSKILRFNKWCNISLFLFSVFPFISMHFLLNINGVFSKIGSNNTYQTEDIFIQKQIELYYHCKLYWLLVSCYPAICHPYLVLLTFHCFEFLLHLLCNVIDTDCVLSELVLLELGIL